MPNFINLDLNLLRVFDALFEERSVTRAGSRLGVAQSAVSHALARLRDLLGDELFIKGPDGMLPTAKARAVGPRLRAGLLELQSALIADAFDPATADYRYHIAASPYACAILLPKIVQHVRSHAPGVEIRVSQDTIDITEALDTGRLDLAIGGYSRAPERLGRRDLLHDRLVWVLRAGHPSVQEPLAEHYRLRLMEPPYQGPETQLSIVWHLQHGASPALKWLLGAVGGIADSIDA